MTEEFKPFKPKIEVEEEPESPEQKEKIEDGEVNDVENKELSDGRYPSIAEHWNSDRYKNTRRDDLIPILLDTLQIEDDHTILEPMCGTAIPSLIIKEMNPKVNICGLDFCHEMLTLIPKEKGVMRVRSNVIAMPFDDETFDRVLLRTAIYDLDRRKQRNALQEISRTMKDDAVFVLQTYVTDENTHIILNEIVNMRDKLAGNFKKMGKNRYPRYFAKKEGLEKHFEKVGLKYEIVHEFVSNIEMSKISESSESNKRQLLYFISGFSKEEREAINFKADEENNIFGYDWKGIIYKLTKEK